MNPLRDELRGIADEAPQVDLAERAIKGGRRRRAAATVLAVAATVTMVTGGTVALVNLGPGAESPIAASPTTGTVPELPKEGVGALAGAYVYRCPTPTIDGEDCADQWRVVTGSGETYELTDAMHPEERANRILYGPMAITQDGRRIAYYSEKEQTIEVRDLASGRTWKAPLKISKNDLYAEGFLRLSGNGLHLIYTNHGGMPKQYSVLVDMEKGTTAELNGDWYPLSVGDGGTPVTLARPYDKTTQIQVQGNEPITIEEFALDLSPLAPDGHTIARLSKASGPDANPPLPRARTIVTTNAIGGGDGPRVQVQGVPKELILFKLGAWVSDTEVTLLAVPESSESDFTAMLYAVDVRTGKTRELRKAGTATPPGAVILPGIAR